MKDGSNEIDSITMFLNPSNICWFYFTDLSSLYKIFEWLQTAASRLILDRPKMIASFGFFPPLKSSPQPFVFFDIREANWLSSFRFCRISYLSE